jgi:hypothetical protein
MIIITNSNDKPVTCAARQYKPGENKVRDAELSPAKLAQISNHPSLKWVKVEDRPIDEKPAKKGAN